MAVGVAAVPVFPESGCALLLHIVEGIVLLACKKLICQLLVTVFAESSDEDIGTEDTCIELAKLLVLLHDSLQGLAIAEAKVIAVCIASLERATEGRGCLCRCCDSKSYR